MLAHFEKFVCPEAGCGCQYELFGRFALHVQAKHINGESHRCKHCDQQADNFDALQAHLKTDCKERKFECTHCGEWDDGTCFHICND